MTRQRRIVLVAAALGLVFAPGRAPAQEAIPTGIVVRAVAHDAKLIGTGVGGARITIRDVAADSILAEGVTAGGTGDTGILMKRPRTRGETVYDTPGAAAFSATLPLSRPTLVEILAEGPLDYPEALARASETVLLVPGEPVVGEGIVLDLHGYIVEILSPAAHATPAGGSIAVRARVRLLCGCPTGPGGIWDSDRIRITARLLEGGTTLSEVPLAYAGETSTYAGALPAAGAGDAVLEVLAVDAGRANAGRARIPVTLGAAR